MKVVLLIVSILLIAIVLLQSGKAESTGGVISGGTDGLFSNRKERGGELFISRLTLILGLALFLVCIAMNIIK
ncbi:MAG: preprotein translocase subunit SecG [Bacilli bacterium]|nr:preprotein translocase subunit SecG [Bacilli bacterium]